MQGEANATRVVALSTPHGALRIRLKPSGTFQRAFRPGCTLGDFCTVKCEFYRAEPASCCRER